jgi:hypothetical protein
MKYSLIALLTLCVITGCASKKHESTPPDSARLIGCHEVSVDAKTGYVTVICPPQVKK